MARSVASLRAVLILALAASACGRTGSPAPAAAADSATLNVTSWTDKSELYMEYPPLIAGQSVRFAVHLTRLADFQALNAGRPSIEFVPEGGGAARALAGAAPSRPGAFRVEGTVPPVGRYRWALIVDAPGLSDRHEIGLVTVFPDEAAARADAAQRPPEDPAAVAYLKEQQWTNAFATELVREGTVRTAVRVPATIEPVTGGEAVVAAPAAGRYAADQLPSIGQIVRANQVLGRIEPRLASGEDRMTLAAAVTEAQVQVDAVRAEQARAERLLADRAVPARRVEEAHRAVTIAETRLHAAEARLSQRDETLRTGGGGATGNAFALRAPMAGRITNVMATLGASYDEAAVLFRIVRTEEVELQAQVPAVDVAGVRDIEGLALELPGRPDPIDLRFHHRHDPGVLDEKTRALPMQFEVDNSGGQLLIGQSGIAVLYKRDRQRVPVIPNDAVLVEAGRPYVFVQIAGERFARRPIEIAAREHDRVGIKSGVAVGDRVVTRGAYDIQLASAAKGLPAEGHVH
jgi:RND family efflux transporter MFP subunit